MHIRKFVVTVEDIKAESGREVGRTVRRAVASAVIANPFAGRPGADLAELEAMGAEISRQLAERALVALGVAAGDVTAYGKGAIVGTDGEIEHAAALIHPRFGAPVRKVVVKGDDVRVRQRVQRVSLAGREPSARHRLVPVQHARD